MTICSLYLSKSWIPNICCFLMRINSYLCVCAVVAVGVGLVCWCSRCGNGRHWPPPFIEYVINFMYTHTLAHTCESRCTRVFVHTQTMRDSRRWNEIRWMVPKRVVCSVVYSDSDKTQSLRSYFQYDLKVCCSNGKTTLAAADNGSIALKQETTRNTRYWSAVKRMGFHRNDVDFPFFSFHFIRIVCVVF